MDRDEAAELITSTPTYQMWANGQACSVCGALVVMNPEEKAKHDRWHAALATLPSPPEGAWATSGLQPR